MSIRDLALAVMFAALVPQASQAQVRSIAEVQPGPMSVERPVSVASAKEEWEEAQATHVTDADVWSAIGQRLYSAGLYRQSIAAFERSLVLRRRHSPEDARFIADAYAKLGNEKQASRWRASTRGITARPRRRGVMTV